MNGLRYITLLVVLLVAGCVRLPTLEQVANADYGVEPKNYEEQLRAYFTSTLNDPYSAVYTFSPPSRGYVNNAPIFGGGVKDFGYLINVGVNAKNQFGGYVGMQTHRFFFKNGVYTPVNVAADGSGYFVPIGVSSYTPNQNY